MSKIELTNMLDGMNAGLSPLLQPITAPTMLLGCNVHRKLGAITKDIGSVRVSTQIQDNKTIGGMYDFHQNPSTQKFLVTVDDATSDDTQLFYKTPAGAWTEIAAAETAWANVAGAKVEIVGFIGYAFFVGYSDVDGFLPVGSLTDTTFSTVTNVTDMPQAKYILKFNDRLLLLNVRYGGTDYPFRAVVSSIPTAGAITWDTAGAPTSSTGGFFDVGFEHQIMGGGMLGRNAIIFTEYESFIYTGSSLDPAWTVGCSSHRTIKSTSAYMIWVNNDGIWISTGGQPQNVGGNVADFIKAASMRSSFATLVDEIYSLYLGNVTVDGVSYSNLEINLHIPTSTFWLREYASPLAMFAPFNDSGKIRKYMGDTDGNVWNKSKYTDSTIYNSDFYIDSNNQGSAINSAFELPPIRITNLSDQQKVLKFTAMAERAQGLKIQGRVIDQNTRILTPYKPMAEITKFLETFDVNIYDGCLIQFQGTEYGSNPYWSFYGIESESIKKSSSK